MKIKSITTIGIFLLSFTVCLGQNLQIKEKTANFGSTAEDDEPSTCCFDYVNHGNTAVRITKIKTACGCTQAQYKKTAILPLEKGKINVTFYPLGKVGNVNKTVTLYTLDSNHHKDSIILTLKGVVMPSKDPYINYPYAIGPLRLMQTTVNFRTINADRSHMVSIETVNSGDHPLSLSMAKLPPYLSFTTRPQIIGAKQKADIIFIFHPKKMKAEGRFNDTLLLDGVGKLPTLQRTINIKGELVKSDRFKQ